MKKILIIFSFFMTLFFLSGISAEAAESEVLNNQDGTITVNYDNSANEKIKVLVQKSGNESRYVYDVPNGDKKVVCALSQGNGTYSVMVCKNTSGNKYSVLSTSDVTLNLSDANKAFLSSSQIVNWESTNKAIKYANKITKNSKTQYKKIQVIYKYIIENYEYDYDKLKTLSTATGYVPNIDTIFKAKKGICYDISALNASMLRSLGIKTKLIMGYSTNSGLEGVYHAWNKVYNVSTKSWMTMDLTYDVCKYNKVNYKVMKKAAKYYSNESFVY